MHALQPELPGLGLDTTDLGELPLRKAVERTLLAYDEAGLLSPMHAATAQLAMTLAETIDRSRTKASAAAMAAGQLLAALDKLPQPTETSEIDKLEQLLAALAENEPART